MKGERGEGWVRFEAQSPGEAQTVNELYEVLANSDDCAILARHGKEIAVTGPDGELRELMEAVLRALA
jgi:hypothetical protein